jgi:tetratricopeptide (TPR) repeat protein
MSNQVDPHFAQAILANLVYWQQANLLQEPDHFNLENANLRRAIQYGLKLPATQITAATLLRQLFIQIEHQGYWHAWLPLLAEAAAVCQGEHLHLRCQLLNRYGQLLRLTRQLETAVTIHQQAESVATEVGDTVLLAETWFQLSKDYRQQRRYGEAEANGFKALTTVTPLPTTEKLQAAVLNTLGLIAYEQGQLTLAAKRLEESVALWRPLDDPTELARALNSLAMTWQAQGNFEAAIAAYQEAADKLISSHVELDQSKILLSLGTLYFQLDQFDQAEAAFRQADTVALRQSGDSYLRGIQAQNLGNVLLKQGRFAETIFHLRRGLAFWQEAGSPAIMLANTVGTLAEAMAAQKEERMALQLYDEALQLLAGEAQNAMANRLRAEFTAKREEIRD